MRCLNCGEKVKSSQKYCLKCGCENKWTFKRKLLYFISLFLIIYFTYAFGLTILLLLFGLLFAQTVNPIELFMHFINPFNNSVDYNVAHFMAILIICFIVYFCLKASNSFIARKAKNKNDNVLNNTIQSNNENSINNQTYIRSQKTKETGYAIIFLGVFVFALAFISSFISQIQTNKEKDKQALERVEMYASKLNSYVSEYHQKYGYDKTPSSYCDINPENKPIMLDIQCDIEFDYWYGVKLSHCLVNHRANKSYGYDGKEAYVEKKKQFTKDSNQCLK